MKSVPFLDGKLNFDDSQTDLDGHRRVAVFFIYLLLQYKLPVDFRPLGY